MSPDGGVFFGGNFVDDMLVVTGESGTVHFDSPLPGAEDFGTVAGGARAAAADARERKRAPAKMRGKAPLQGQARPAE